MRQNYYFCLKEIKVRPISTLGITGHGFYLYGIIPFIWRFLWFFHNSFILHGGIRDILKPDPQNVMLEQAYRLYRRYVMDAEHPFSSGHYKSLIDIYEFNRSKAEGILDYMARYSRFIHPPKKKNLLEKLAQLQRTADEAKAQMGSLAKQDRELRMLNYKREISNKRRVDAIHKISDIHRIYEVLGGAPGLGKRS